MSVRKNIQFSIRVKMEGRVRELNFRQRSADLYDGDTSDEQGARWIFTWKHDNGNWELQSTPHGGALPGWLLHNTSAIRESFLTELL